MIGEVVTMSCDDIKWQNEDGSLKDWSILFDYPEDLFYKHFTGQFRHMLQEH